jgi:hypothetical protein
MTQTATPGGCLILPENGVWAKKKMAGREYMGIVRSTFLVDPHGVIRKVWSVVFACLRIIHGLYATRRWGPVADSGGFRYPGHN